MSQQDGFHFAMSLGKRVSWLDNNASRNLRCEVPNASAAFASSATAQCLYHVFEAVFATQSTIAGGKIICFAPCDADETRAYFTLCLGWERFWLLAAAHWYACDTVAYLIPPFL